MPSIVSPKAWDVLSFKLHLANISDAVLSCKSHAVYFPSLRNSSNTISPVFWLCMGQTGGNVISLAAHTNTYGLPNDFSAYPASEDHFYHLTRHSNVILSGWFQSGHNTRTNTVAVSRRISAFM